MKNVYVYIMCKLALETVLNLEFGKTISRSFYNKSLIA